MLGYLNEHLQLKRQALNAYQRLDIGDVLLPGLFFFKTTIHHYSIHTSLFFPELLNCFSPTPQRKSWHSLLATTGELCGEYFFSSSSFCWTENWANVIPLLSLCVCRSSTGQWDEAVRIHNSTQPQESTDLCSLALACCSAGLIAESFSGEDRDGALCVCVHTPEWVWLSSCCCCVAYERALAVASTEREKSYISTALALLLHRQGDVDSAKTLLFKWWAHSVACQAEI